MFFILIMYNLIIVLFYLVNLDVAIAIRTVLQSTLDKLHFHIILRYWNHLQGAFCVEFLICFVAILNEFNFV